MTARILGHALFGAIAGSWVGRALFKWVLDFEGTTLILAIAGCAVVGLILGVASGLESG